MRKGKKVVSLILAACLAFGCAACGAANEAVEEKTEAITTEAADDTAEATEDAAEEHDHDRHKIGVAVYNNTDDEVLMFQDYYKSYLEEAFAVDFLYSSPISTMDDEKAFVDAAKEEGCEGIISFVTTDLSDIVEYCGNDLYYVMGSGSVAEEEYEEACAYDNFLGIMGPSLENETNAGSTMIESLGGEDGSNKTYVLLAGGASIGNSMHKTRLLGMLDTLENKYGFTLNASAEEIAASTENILAATSADGGQVYVTPGYLSLGTELVETLFAEIDPDVVASTNVAYPVFDLCEAEEAQSGKDVKVGTVDCYGEVNGMAFEKGQLDVIVGKCAAMGAPAFIAMYNAITGHCDIVKDGGKAFWLNQDFWTAASTEEYAAQAAAAQSIFDNIYTTKDMMDCMGEYTPEANFDTFKAFVEKLTQ